MKKIFIILLVIVLIIAVIILGAKELNSYYTVEGTIVGINEYGVYIGSGGNKRRAK